MNEPDERIRMMQKIIRSQLKGEKVKRCYDLPFDLVADVLDYQIRHGIKSEVAAIRRLLQTALKNHWSDDDLKAMRSKPKPPLAINKIVP